MKNQMTVNQFILIAGIIIIAGITISATGKTTDPLSHQQTALEEQFPSAPANAILVDGLPDFPFTFYLSLMTFLENGGSLGFDLVEEDGQSFFSNETPEWDKEQ
jgi:hypothetical protein